MKLKMEHYKSHNFHNDKVIDWVLENHIPTVDQFSGYGLKGNNWGCLCLTGEGPKDDDSDFEYIAYYDKIDAEWLVQEGIEGLTEQDKEEILDIENLRIYACPTCEKWSLDGDNC